MNEILNMSINEMPQVKFDCECGKNHFLTSKRFHSVKALCLILLK